MIDLMELVRELERRQSQQHELVLLREAEFEQVRAARNKAHNDANRLSNFIMALQEFLRLTSEEGGAL